MIDGGWVSITVTVKLQLAVLLTASITEQVTVVVPCGKAEPEGGLQSGVPTPGQLSLTVGRLNVTTAVQRFGSVACVIFAGQVIEGGCVSCTVTVNVQVGPSELVQVTVVAPTGKNEPEAGLQVIVPQFPLGIAFA